MKEERLQILKMIQEGIITADEGAKLLAALGAGEEKSQAPQPFYTPATPYTAPESRRWLRIRVTEKESGHARVNLSVPLALLDWALRFAEVGGGINLGIIRDAVKGGAEGKIIEVDDNSSRERVEIFVE